MVQLLDPWDGLVVDQGIAALDTDVVLMETYTRAQ